MIPVELSTTDLVVRCRQGDDRAWCALVDRYARLVHATAVKHNLAPADVDDIGQEVFLALSRSLHEIEDPERLPGWLLTTTRRACWRLVQRRRAEQTADEVDLASDETIAAASTAVSTAALTLPSLASLLDTWHRQDVLATVLPRLQERCRLLLALLFLDDAEPGYDEISRQLGLPLGSIGPTRNRCLAKLRDLLEAAGFSRHDL